MTFIGLILGNIRSRPLRATLTAAAVAIGVMAVVALGVLTASLKQTAAQLLQVGYADFTVSQKHTDDLINSQFPQSEIAEMAKVPGVKHAVGVLISTDKYDADHPLMIEVGLQPTDQAPFGVHLLTGRSYTADSTDEVMLGYVFANDIHKKAGDPMTIAGKTYRVTGLFRTNVSFGNSTVMFPLPNLQGMNRLTGQVSLGFVQVESGPNGASGAAAAKKAQIEKVRTAIDERFPQLTTITSTADYGRADRNLTLISAANTGGSILAGVIAISGVLNTSLMSFFERIREFGIYRAIGWTRTRVISLVIGEAIVVSLVGALFGVALGWAAINLLQHFSTLRGILDPVYDVSVFVRSIEFGLIVAFLGALYPALRAAFVVPLKAMRRE